MNMQAVLLSGGGSRRMGFDKASFEIGGISLAERTARALRAEGCAVTVLGREPLPDFAFQKDVEEHRGPLAAVAGFEPEAPLVFAASCDMPAFDARIVHLLAESIGDCEAAVPRLRGRLQPACALYRASAFQTARDCLREDKLSLMGWLDRLSVVEIGEDELASAGLEPDDFANVNTPEELESALRRLDEGRR